MKHQAEEWADLPPALRTALESLRPVPELPPLAQAADRHLFLLEARQFAAQAVSARLETRRNRWKARFDNLLRGRQMMKLVGLSAVVILVLAAFVGTVSAAQASLPGSVLYSLKVAWEEIQLSLTTDPAAQVERAMDMAQERVEETLALAQQGVEVPHAVAERYQAHLALALQALGSVPEPIRTQLQARVAERFAAQTQQMEQVMTRLQAGSAEGTALRQMVRELEQAQERLREQEHLRQQGPAVPTLTPGPTSATPTPTAHPTQMSTPPSSGPGQTPQPPPPGGAGSPPGPTEPHGGTPHPNGGPQLTRTPHATIP